MSNPPPSFDDDEEIYDKKPNRRFSPHVRNQKPLPPPPKVYNAKHGGPISPVLDSGMGATMMPRRQEIHTQNINNLSRTIGEMTLRDLALKHQENLFKMNSSVKGSFGQSIGGSRPIQQPQAHQPVIQLPSNIKGSSGLRLEIPATAPKVAPPKISLDFGAIHNEGSTHSEARKPTGFQPINMNLIQKEQADPMDKSYFMSKTGCFHSAGFEINQNGIRQSPGERESDRASMGLKNDLLSLSVLGRGASGVVYKMIHRPSLKTVAVKKIPVFEQGKRHQMVQELRTLNTNSASLTSTHSSKIPCPFIVGFFDAFVVANEGSISIVVEYMDGGSLQDIIDTGGIPHEAVLKNIAYRVVHGLSFIHERHQIHRDIKPSNLLINHNGDVKISDFGIVKELGGSMDKANTFVGTLLYMSPERVAGESYDCSSDIWSFGLAMITLATGVFPLKSDGGYWGVMQNLKDQPSPSLPSKEFSEEFCDFIDQCLKKNPERRSSAAELKSHPFLRGVTVNVDDSAEISDEGAETAKRDLSDMCEIVMKSYHDDALAKSSRRSTLPRLHTQSTLMKDVAVQLGISPVFVGQRFQAAHRLFSEKLARHRVAQKTQSIPSPGSGSMSISSGGSFVGRGSLAGSSDPFSNSIHRMPTMPTSHDEGFVLRPPPHRR
eukprot:TRINITY_DN1215_c0_g2_i1.p1 TRINITY_DN1215_c0_g2~~TRINITY_DN1215_c0_g2_i1.p1  ORF type:complete len:661 (-),score=214.10 TRINITY_DN1215_c0_g2_i1:233-2215(-)